MTGSPSLSNWSVELPQKFAALGAWISAAADQLNSLHTPSIFKLLLLSLVLLIGLLVSSYCSHRIRRSELRKLRNGIRSLVRREPPEGRVSFQDGLMDEVWHQVIGLASRTRSVESTKSTFDEVITLGSKIAGMSDELSATAEEVVGVLHSRTQPEVLAAGLLLRNEKSGEVELTALRGIPANRIKHSLLISFDALLSENIGGAPQAWGYQVPKRGSLFDLSTFGIGLSLTLPLRDHMGICGGLWLGFKEGASSLTPPRKALVQAIAEHTAATFYASRKFTQKTKASESERDFLLGMSHDLRAPGNSALYALRDLLSGELGPLTEEQHVRLSIIEKSLEDQLGILGDVLDYAKHQKGFLEANTQAVEIKTMLKRLLDTFTLAAAQRGIRLQSDPVPDFRVHFDPRHLQRILSNFLSNALKYTESGSVTISFHRDRERLEISVADTGIGVPTESREELFSEFKRLKNVGNRQGVGLGLALSKALAEINQGYVFYEPNTRSPTGTGSVFGVGAPIASLSDEQDRGSIPSVYLRSILVVDDDPAVCRMNVRYLRDLADTVVPAGTISEAVDLARELRPELIVTDLYVGPTKATELLKTLRESAALGPVIVLTGSASPRDTKELITDFGALILEKPVGREQLFRTISDLFAQPSRLAANF